MNRLYRKVQYETQKDTFYTGKWPCYRTVWNKKVAAKMKTDSLQLWNTYVTNTYLWKTISSVLYGQWTSAVHRVDDQKFYFVL